MTLIKHITNKDYESANKVLEENFKVILESKLHEMKKMCAATMEQNTHAERMKRLRLGVLEQQGQGYSDTSRLGGGTRVTDPQTIRSGVRDLANQMGFQGQSSSTSTYSTTKDGKTTTTTITTGNQPNQGRTQGSSSSSPSNSSRGVPGYSDTSRLNAFEEQNQITEDDIEEGLLDIAKRKLKLRSPLARANASEKPVMKSMSGKPMGKRLKIAPKNLEEEVEQLDEAPRVGIVKLRIRGGKVQRRQKVSNVPGMTLRSGKLTRMSPAERRRRKLGAIKAARKTKAKKSQILRKRKMSLMKRARLGG